MAGGSAVPGRLAHGHRVNEPLLRDLVPAVIGVLVQRGADFAAAEDAGQDALVEAVRVWPDDPPRDPKGWLVTVAWRKFLDAARADTFRRLREVRVDGEPMPGPGEVVDDTLQLYFLCAHPSLTPTSAVALTLRAVAGLLALMLLHHARRPARTGPDGRLVPLTEQDRSLWNTRLIAEGVDVLQTALTRDRLGEFQAQAAIAALHADARTAEETDWAQIVEWYDELVRLTDSPVARLNRAVAVGEADGPGAGPAALAELDPALPRHTAAAAYLHERDGDPVTAARLYAQAARSAPNLPERDHLTRQAARLNAQLRS